MNRDQAARLVRTLEGYLIDYSEQYLIPKGWFESIQCRRPVSSAGEPLPWITYPALRILPALLKPSFRILEYGCGWSSLWFSTKVARVISVEHDGEWARSVNSRAANNNVIVHVPRGTELEPDLCASLPAEFADPARSGSYAAEAFRYPPEYFQVIFIDGIERVLCTWAAVRTVSRRGFILFDNSDREQYEPAYRVLREAGFRRVDYWGTGPVNPYEWCTSVFFGPESRVFE